MDGGRAHACVACALRLRGYHTGRAACGGGDGAREADWLAGCACLPHLRRMRGCMQMHACPIPSACSYSNRTALLVAYQNLLTEDAINLSGGKIATNETGYLDLQCSDGYEGNLCAGALAGP